MRFKNFVVLFAIFVIFGVLIGGGVFYSVKKKRAKILEKINYAKTQLDNKDQKGALKTLAGIYPDARKTAFFGEVSWLLAQTSLQLNQLKEAKTYAENMVKDFPNSEYSQKGKFILGQIIIQEGDNLDEAVKYFKEIASSKTESPITFMSNYYLAEIEVQKGNLENAKNILDQLYEKQLSSEDFLKVEDTLGKVNIKLLYSRSLMEGDILYELEKGDSIYKLSRKFKVSQSLIMACNGITDPNRLTIGQRIKIPKIDFSIQINKSDNSLTLLNNGKFFKKYLVRTGKYDHLTPNGKFKILNKKVDPTWTDPKTHKVYGAGDPENELGSRWLSFQGDQLGIHGTIHPETIGQYSSNGCVGMLKEDVEELYELVNVGTSVDIIGKKQ